MPQITRLLHKKMGEILIEAGLIKDDQLKTALEHKAKNGCYLGESLVELGYLKETDIAYALSKQYGFPYLDATKYVIQVNYSNLASTELMWKNRFVILDKIGNCLILAVSGVIPDDLIEQIEQKSKCTLFVYISTVGQIQHALKKYYKLSASLNGFNK